MDTTVSFDDYENLLAFIEETSEAETALNFQEVVLSKTKEYFGFTHSNFMLYDRAKNTITYPVTMNVTKSIMDLYYTQWSEDIFSDPFIHYLGKGFDSSTCIRSRLIFFDDLMLLKEWENSGYYNEYIKKLGFYAVAGISLFSRKGFMGGIGVFKQNDVGLFTHREKYILNRIGLHISASLENYLSINRDCAEKQLLRVSLDEMNVGTILLDQDCKITYFNKAADKFCSTIFEDESPEHFNKFLNHLGNTIIPSLRQTKIQLNYRNHKFRIDIFPVIFTSEYRTMESRYVIYIRNLPPGNINIDRKLSELYKLSKRELEVVQLIMEGLDNTAIANRLYLSSHTVKTHIQNIFTKMKIHNRTSILRIINEMKQDETAVG